MVQYHADKNPSERLPVVSIREPLRSNTAHLKFRVLAPLALLFVGLLIAASAALYSHQREHLSETLTQTLVQAERAYRSALQEHGHKIEAWLLPLSENQELTRLFAARDRAALLAAVQPVFQRLRSAHQITHLYFHDPSRHNFLRLHQPETYGDLIDRITARAAAREGRPVMGVELGHFGTLTLRAVAPLRDDGRLVGFLELGEEVEPIIEEVREILDVHLVLAIDKRYLTRAEWEQGMTQLGRRTAWDLYPDHVVPLHTLPEPPRDLDAIIQALRDGIVESTQTFNGDRRTLYVGGIPLLDAGDRGVGTILVFRDMTEQVLGTNRTIVSIVVVGHVQIEAEPDPHAGLDILQRHPRYGALVDRLSEILVALYGILSFRHVLLLIFFVFFGTFRHERQREDVIVELLAQTEAAQRKTTTKIWGQRLVKATLAFLTLYILIKVIAFSMNLLSVLRGSVQ